MLSAKGHNSFKNRRTEKSQSHANLPTIILLCAKFRQNPSRNVGVAFTRNCGRTDGKTDDIMMTIPFGQILPEGYK
jgi:hypothetical protein